MTHAATAPTGSGLRVTLGLPLAAIITAALFLAMGALIRGDGAVLVEKPEGVPVIEILRKPPPETTITEIERPTLPETTPPPATSPVWENAATTGVPVGPVTKPAIAPGNGGVSITPGLSGALLQYQPIYPERCAARGLEGSVTVRFDVTAAGGVANAVVAQSSNGCFDRAALEAIARWKFQPTGRGSAIAQSGLTKTFRFQLQG